MEADAPPERIARGVAVGSFIAVTPTVGIQLYLALAVATAVGGNRAAAVAMTFVLNPLIFVPPSWWYFPAYYIGTFLLNMEPVGLSAIIGAYHLEAAGIAGKLSELAGNLWQLGLGVFGPMLLGGAVMGVPIALLMYRLSFRLIVSYRRKREAQAAPAQPAQGDEPGGQPRGGGAASGGGHPGAGPAG